MLWAAEGFKEEVFKQLAGRDCRSLRASESRFKAMVAFKHIVRPGRPGRKCASAKDWERSRLGIKIWELSVFWVFAALGYMGSTQGA